MYSVVWPNYLVFFLLQMYAFPLYYASSGSKVAVMQQASKVRPRTKSPSHKMRVHHEESSQQVSQYYILEKQSYENIHADWLKIMFL